MGSGASLLLRLVWLLDGYRLRYEGVIELFRFSFLLLAQLALLGLLVVLLLFLLRLSRALRGMEGATTLLGTCSCLSLRLELLRCRHLLLRCRRLRYFLGWLVSALLLGRRGGRSEGALRLEHQVLHAVLELFFDVFIHFGLRTNVEGHV